MSIGRAISAAIVSSFLLASTPAFSDDAAEANRFFVTAVKAFNEAGALSGNGLAVAENRFLLLDDVTRNLKRIINDYSGADLAVRLMIGEEIGPVSMVRVQQNLNEARSQLAAALADCHDPALCLTNLALKEARRIEEPRLRASVLSQIAKKRISFELLEETLAAFDETEGGRARDDFLSSFAYAQFMGGDLEAAQKTAERIVEKRIRGNLYNYLVSELASTGQFSTALEIAARPLDDAYDDRAGMFEDIAVAQAIAGRTADALLTVGAIEDRWSRSNALEQVSIAQAEAGLLSEAITTADAIKHTGPYVGAVSQLAISKADSSYFAVALDAARTMEDERARGYAHWDISEAQAKLGLFAEAAETLSGVAWEAGRDAGFERIAVAQAKTGQYSDALGTVERINSSSSSDDALRKIAALQTEAGFFSDALKTVQKIQEPSAKDAALSLVSGFNAKAGRFTEAFEIAGQISGRAEKGEALEQVAVALANARQFTEAVAMARKIMSIGYQGRALRNIAHAQAEADMLTAAIHTALEQPEVRYRAMTLFELSNTSSE